MSKSSSGAQQRLHSQNHSARPSRHGGRGHLVRSLSCLLRNAPCTHRIKAVSGALTAANASYQEARPQCLHHSNKHWSRHAFRDIPKAQCTFNNLLFHGILQFTMFITIRCILHRCLNRDIHYHSFPCKQRPSNKL